MTIQKTLYLALALVLVACDRGQDADGSMTATDAAGSSPPQAKRDMGERQRMAQVGNEMATLSGAPDAPSMQGPPVPAQAAAATPAMMIRTGYATLEVSKLDPAIEKVRALATKVGGYVTNTSTSGGRDQVRAAMLELRVPAQRYDETIQALADIGRVETTQTSAQDVGEEFVDVTARVSNARKLETRLRDLLANRTGRLQDVLAVERELSRVRTEIDQMEGRLRYLKDRVSLSTLTINLHEPQPLIGNIPGENPIGAAVRQAWRNFVGFFASVIASLGILIPVAAIGAVIWFLVRKKIGKGA